MKRKLILVGLVALTLVAFKGMTRLYALPWPHFEELNVGPHGLEDVSMILAGFRRAAADMAWVQLLQFLGEAHELEEARLNPKESLKGMTLRVTRIDPYFRSVYLVGAGILAWFPRVDRPDEALEVLREGVRYNPEYWPFQIYIAAILYKKQGRFPEMAQLLEEGRRHPECPPVMKSILANTYKAQKRYADAIRIWQIVLSNPQDREYHETARRQIERMSSLR